MHGVGRIKVEQFPGGGEHGRGVSSVPTSLSPDHCKL
jgi:hypothetical protein